MPNGLRAGVENGESACERSGEGHRQHQDELKPAFAPLVGSIQGGGSGRKIGAGGTDIPDLYPFRDEFVALKF